MIHIYLQYICHTRADRELDLHLRMLCRSVDCGGHPYATK